MPLGERQTSNKIELQKELNPAKDFSAPTYEEWKTAAEKSLKGVSFEKLITPTDEGIDMQPVYTGKDIAGLPHLEQRPGFPYYLRGATAGGYLERPWEICQEISAPLADRFNEQLKHDLRQGQTAIHLSLDLAAQKGLDSDAAAPGEIGKDGVAVSTLADLAAALAGIDIEAYPLHMDCGFSGLEVLMALGALFQQQGKNLRQLNGSIDADPLGFLAAHGNLPVSLPAAYDELAQLLEAASRQAPGLKILGISGLPYHNAGADAVRELAYVLAAAVEYIDRLSDRGVSIDNICSHMRFTFGVGPFYFMEIARLRAARMLWAKIVEAYGGSPSAQRMTIHARTSSYYQTRYDPYVNILRATTETFSAVAAGVASVHTCRFNEVSGANDEFSRRVARNIQVLLREECRLDQLIDPAGGSYYIESLTHDVAQKAWQRFREIEAAGGIFNILQKGVPQEETAALHEKRKQAIARREKLLVGTNFSANTNEKKSESPPLDNEAIYRARKHALEEFRQRRTAEQKAAFTEKLSGLKKLLSDSAVEGVKAGAEALSAGATFGELTSLIRPDTPGTGAVAIPPLAPQRAAESYERLRDAGDVS